MSVFTPAESSSESASNPPLSPDICHRHSPSVSNSASASGGFCFARLSSATLSAAMRMVADVDLAFVDQVPYNEFILSLSSSSSAYGFLMDPPGARAILSFSPELLMALVDRSFGGQGLSYNAEPRPLTQIETNIVNKLVNNIFADLESTWELTTPVQISDVTIETNPEFCLLYTSPSPRD